MCVCVFFVVVFFVLCFVSRFPGSLLVWIGHVQQEVMEQFTEDFANLEDDDEGELLYFLHQHSYVFEGFGV